MHCSSNTGNSEAGLNSRYSTHNRKGYKNVISIILVTELRLLRSFLR